MDFINKDDNNKIIIRSRSRNTHNLFMYFSIVYISKKYIGKCFDDFSNYNML